MYGVPTLHGSTSNFINGVWKDGLNQDHSTRSSQATRCSRYSVVLPAERFEMREHFNPSPDKAETDVYVIMQN
jgi:hypothetical protein